MSRSFRPRVWLALAGALVLIAAAPAIAGPPWIAIEYPPNPFDEFSRGAFLVVRTYHHGTPTQHAVTARAEGLVAGARRTIPLTVTRTSLPGVHAIRKQWPDDGLWTLIIVSSQSNATATAVVELDRAGEVAAVRVPTRTQGRWLVPRDVATEEVEARLRARAN